MEYLISFSILSHSHFATAKSRFARLTYVRGAYQRFRFAQVRYAHATLGWNSMLLRYDKYQMVYNGFFDGKFNIHSYYEPLNILLHIILLTQNLASLGSHMFAAL